ncbi:MAG: hypothetical protein NTX11_01355 [Candidatus Saccharibacteria bacterium]|nr:hypothetical protein [Candidatus Saccharibacteria bacterium]
MSLFHRNDTAVTSEKEPVRNVRKIGASALVLAAALAMGIGASHKSEVPTSVPQAVSTTSEMPQLSVPDNGAFSVDQQGSIIPETRATTLEVDGTKVAGIISSAEITKDAGASTDSVQAAVVGGDPTPVTNAIPVQIDGGADVSIERLPVYPAGK